MFKMYLITYNEVFIKYEVFKNHNYKFLIVYIFHVQSKNS